MNNITNKLIGDNDNDNDNDNDKKEQEQEQEQEKEKEQEQEQEQRLEKEKEEKDRQIGQAGGVLVIHPGSRNLYVGSSMQATPCVRTKSRSSNIQQLTALTFIL